jgi:hypothetical protein
VTNSYGRAFQGGGVPCLHKDDKVINSYDIFRTAVTPACIKTSKEPTVDDLLVTYSCVYEAAPFLWRI